MRPLPTRCRLPKCSSTALRTWLPCSSNCRRVVQAVQVVTDLARQMR
jgi:hypothetical protein